MGTEIPRELAPRLCHITRWPDFQGYGFNLHAEKGKAGQFIGKVDEGSPAEASGLREGDRIVEVNGVNIGNENHQQVVTRVRQGGDETRLLVVDSSSDDWFKSNKIVIKGDLSGIVFGTSRKGASEEESLPEPEPEIEKEEVHSVEAAPSTPPVTNGNGYSDDHLYKPRLCHLRLWPHFQGYGFNLHAEKDKPGQYIGLVDDNSPASTAGLKVNDRIVEVNGKNIEKESHSVVIGHIKETPGEARLLVVDPQTDSHYREKGVTVHSSMSHVEYNVTPETPDAAAELEAEADLDDLPPPPEPETGEPEHVETEKVEDVEVEEPQAEALEDGKTNGDGLDAVDAVLAEQDTQEFEAVLPDESTSEPEVEPEPIPVVCSEPEPVPEPEPEPEPVAQQEVEETVNGVKTQEAPTPPEPEFTVAKEPEPVVSKPAPAPEPVKAPAPEAEGLMLNLSVAEMKERLKAKKKADPRHNKISFERKYQQFERM